jgi:hypothetical protein
VSTQPSSKSRLLKEGAKAGDFVSVEQPINDERPLNKRLRDEASEWDVDESVVHLLVEAADAIEHMAAALVAVRAERDQATTALRALWDDLGPKEQRYVDLAVEALVRDVLEAGGRQKPPVVSEATDETLKRNVLGLADHHRATCDGPDCTVSLALLGVLLDRASIGVTEEEARRLW